MQKQNVNTPPANAFEFNVYDYRCAMWIEQIFSTEYGYRTTYFKDDAWHYLAMPSFFNNEIATKEGCDNAFNRCVEAINNAIKEVLKPPGGNEPDSGLEKMDWLMRQLIVVDDQLKLPE